MERLHRRAGGSEERYEGQSMRTAAVLSLVCLCGRTVELPDSAREGKCECGRRLRVEAVRNDELRTITVEARNA